MIRTPGASRYFTALGVVVALAGCGAAAPAAPTIAAHFTTSPSENQQGHRLSELAMQDAEDESGPPTAEQPSIAGVFLWCQSPSGHACRLATAALGTGPKDPSGLPPSLLTVEDLADDCQEPTIATLSARLARAFAVQSTGWRDQVGSYLDMSTLDQMYQAAGCINDADSSRPIAKISAAGGASPRMYLVRVWDAQPSAP